MDFPHSRLSLPPERPGKDQVLSRSAEPSGGIALEGIIEILKKQVWLIAIVALVVASAAAVYGFSQEKIYRARATLQIDPRPPRPLGRGVENVVELGTRGYWATVEYYNTQHKIIGSKPIALIAVRELGLHRDHSFLRNTTKPVTSKSKEPPTPEAAAAVLRSRLSVTPTKESRLVEVTFEDADKKRAVRILNAVLRAYISHNIDRKLQSTSSAVDWLSEQLVSLQEELIESENALHAYKLDKHISSIGIDDQSGILRQEMEQLTGAHTVVETHIQEAAARLAQLLKIDSSAPDSIPQSTLLKSEGLGKLRTEYDNGVRQRQALLRSGKGGKHPMVMAVDGQIQATTKALKNAVDNIKSGAQKELAALQQQKAGLVGLLKDAEDRALQLNLMDIEYSRLLRTKDNNEKLYGIVLERSKEAGLTQMLRVNNIEILSPPEGGKSPVKPRIPLILLAGALGGLLLGFGAALARMQLDQTVDSLDEIEDRLGVTPLGMVPAVAQAQELSARKRRRARAKGTGKKIELTMVNDPTSTLAESIRAVRTNLMFMSPDRPFERVLVTSASPAEGKTTVACCLAIAMAQTGKKVLLIDADMRRPRLLEIFAAPSPRNNCLSEALLDHSKFQPNLLKTDIENLSVLQAGPTPPNPAELLHSASFRTFLDQLSTIYDLVLLDSPPLLVTDAAIISTHVDGTLLVVRAAQTERGAASRAIRAIENVGGQVVGAVLNAAQTSKKGYGYGYGQYGSYGRTSDSSKQAASESPLSS